MKDTEGAKGDRRRKTTEKDKRALLQEEQSTAIMQKR